MDSEIASIRLTKNNRDVEVTFHPASYTLEPLKGKDETTGEHSQPLGLASFPLISLENRHPSAYLFPSVPFITTLPVPLLNRRLYKTDCVS